MLLSQTTTETTTSDDQLKGTYTALCKPELASFLNILKLDRIYHRALGNNLYTYRDGKEVAVLDLVGGYGSTILGHSNSALRALCQRNLDDLVPMHAQGSIRPGAAKLATLLNELVQESFSELAPPDYVLHLLNTGTEATEGALKHALMAWQEQRRSALHQLQKRRSVLRTRQLKRADAVDTSLEASIARLDASIAALNALKPQVVAIDGSFHGKTAGSLAVTNPAYGKMYDSAAISRMFIPASADTAQLDALFNLHTVDLEGGIKISTFAAVICELIQGEGGIKPLPKVFVQHLATLCGKHAVPLIADEVQTGMFRTGTMFAAQHYGVLPDYFTLGKSLGGGLAKIAAVLIRKDRYVPAFSMTHTSTFAEDDASSLVAVRTIELIRSLPVPIGHLARKFEYQLFAGLKRLEERYPGVIKEVRGQGFLVGIEFHTEFAGKRAAFVDALVKSGQYVYMLASYLLNRHDIRVAATLNQSNTLRIEPSLLTSRKDIERILSAFEDLLQLVAAGRFLAISAHIWLDSTDYRDALVSSFVDHKALDLPAGTRRVDFLTHTIDEQTLKTSDPMFQYLSDRDRLYFLTAIAPTQTGVKYHEQLITGDNGETVLLSLRGVAVSSRFFEQSLRSGDGTAYEKTRDMAIAAISEGASHIGLGQFTSIVTSNGLDLEDLPVHLTTGNSFTVGSCYLAVMRALAEQGRAAKDLRIGVVGAAGNIGSVLAQLLADSASELVLIHRENIGKSAKFQAVVTDIANCSTLPRDRIKTSSDPAVLKDCDIIILSVNSTDPIVFSEHLSSGAIVLDVSVPSVVAPEALKRDDVTFLFGGQIKLPLGQTLGHPNFSHIDGEVYACMAETITTSLLNLPRSFSLGALTKEQVLESIDMALKVGMQLGGSRDRFMKSR